MVGGVGEAGGCAETISGEEGGEMVIEIIWGSKGLFCWEKIRQMGYEL